MKLKKISFSKVNDIPLNFKFLIIYIICILIPMVIINAVFIVRFSSEAYERESNNFKISMERTRTDIDTIIESCIAVGHSISTDRTLFSLLDYNYFDSNDYYSVYDSNLRQRLTTYTTPYNYIQNIVLYVDNPTIRNGGNYFYIDSAVKATDWYKDINKAKEHVLIKPYMERTDSVIANRVKYLSVLFTSDHFYTFGYKKKVLKIDIDLSKLLSIMSREKEYLTLFLVDPDNNIVCSSNDKYSVYEVSDFKKYDEGFLTDDKSRLESQLGKNRYLKGWKLVGITKSERFSQALTNSLSFVVLFALASIIVSFFLTYIMVRSYNYRLKKLSKHILKINDGQFNLIDINEGKDEIGGVIRNFNVMASKINTLINDVYKLELQKKNLELERVRAELNFLQSQMNPHFLFNTLNALLVVCIKNNYTAVIDILKYLSKTLRRLLSWKDDLVTIREELEFTEMYLKIENFRFCDKNIYTISVNDELLNYKIPKMSMQPLVENACKHGLQSIVGTGKINIDINMSDEGLRISVEDNGSGMDSNKLNQIINCISDEKETSSHIGIRNVYRRLKLFYGDEVDFNIESTLNVGTIVYFVIPATKLDRQTE